MTFGSANQGWSFFNWPSRSCPVWAINQSLQDSTVHNIWYYICYSAVCYPMSLPFINGISTMPKTPCLFYLLAQCQSGLTQVYIHGLLLNRTGSSSSCISHYVKLSGPVYIHVLTISCRGVRIHMYTGVHVYPRYRLRHLHISYRAKLKSLYMYYDTNLPLQKQTVGDL